MDVINQLKNDYGDFGDALIVNFEYFSGFNFEKKSYQEEEVSIAISCFNINKPFGQSNELILLNVPIFLI